MFRNIFIMVLICIFANGSEVKLENDISNQIYKLANKETFQKVYASNPVLLYHLYSFDKNRIAGLVFEFYDSEKRFLDENVTSLPVVGGFFGQGRVPNIEMVLELKPDLILASPSVKTDEKYGKIFSSLHVFMLYVDALDLNNSIKTYEVFGEVFDNKERADELIKYATDSFKLSDELLAKKLQKPKIYYAFGDNGLQSECAKSSFGDMVSLAGARLSIECENLKQNSRVSVNFEQILQSDPDIIIAYDKSFYEKVFDDKKWQALRAVRAKNVYLIPRDPFSWVGKPASFMRFLGIRWLIETIHPDVFKIDIKQEAREFYQKFLYINLNDEELKIILNEKN